VVTRSAVRLSHRQLEELAALDDGRLPMAEVHRRFARAAAARGLPRPSYERTRLLLHELRRLRRQQVRSRDVMLEIVFRQRAPEALVDHLAGLPLPPIRSL
jgi:hypothetical protein